MKRLLLASLVALLASPAGAQQSDWGPFPDPYVSVIRMDSRFPIYSKINEGMTDQIVAFEDFNQAYVDQTAALFVDGLHDLAWENAGWVVTPVGTPANFLLRALGARSSSYVITPGDDANEGFNYQFTRIGRPTIAAVGQTIHTHDIHDFDFHSFAPVALSWAARVGLGTGDTTFTWTSGLVVGVAMENDDSPVDGSFMNSATKALTIATNADGCYFHIAATGLLTFHCADGTTTNAAANCATVNIGDVLETDPHDTSGYPVFVDLGFSIDEPLTVGSGTAQAYYRILEQTPSPVPVPQWTTFCDPITGANIPGASGSSGNAALNSAFEIVQGAAGDAVTLYIDWIASAWSREGRVGCPGGSC